MKNELYRSKGEDVSGESQPVSGPRSVLRLRGPGGRMRTDVHFPSSVMT